MACSFAAVLLRPPQPHSRAPEPPPQAFPQFPDTPRPMQIMRTTVTTNMSTEITKNMSMRRRSQHSKACLELGNWKAHDHEEHDHEVRTMNLLSAISSLHHFSQSCSSAREQTQEHEEEGGDEMEETAEVKPQIIIPCELHALDE